MTTRGKTRKPKSGPLLTKYDPSRTRPLRRRMEAAINRAFAALRRDVIDQVERGDVFGLALVGNSNPEGCNQYKPCGAGSSPAALHQTATDVMHGMLKSWSDRQGAEPRLSPKEICEGWCSNFAVGALRQIQTKLGRDPGPPGKANETADAHLSRTNMDEKGDGHMWVTVAGRHYDAETPAGVHDPRDIPWMQRHPGFKVLPREEWVDKRTGVVNAFCATGEGGGIDPRCSPVGSKHEVVTDDGRTYTTKFHADGKEFFFEGVKDEEGWHIGFGRQSHRGGNTAMMTHDPTVSPIKVLREVQLAIDHFVKAKQPETMLFTAEKWEKSRVKLYDRVVGEIGKTYGYVPETHDYPALKEYVLRKQTSNTFCATGEGGHVDPTCSPGEAKGGGGPEVKKLGHIERIYGKAAGAYAREKANVRRGYEKVTPRPVKAALSALAHVYHALEHPLKASYEAGQRAALAVAREKGLNQHEVDRLAKTLGMVDGALRWTGNVPAAHEMIAALSSLGGPVTFGAAKLGFYVPVGSLAYVATSAVTDPAATISAARRAIRRRMGKPEHVPHVPGPARPGYRPELTPLGNTAYDPLGHPITLYRIGGPRAGDTPILPLGYPITQDRIDLGVIGAYLSGVGGSGLLGASAGSPSPTANVSAAESTAVFAAMEAHDWDDRYEALLIAAADETGGDVARAIRLADEEWAATDDSRPTEAPAANAQDWRFRTSADKLREFGLWLRQRAGYRLRNATEDALWQKYIEDGYRQGLGRAWDDTSRLRRRQRTADQPDTPDYHKGSRDQFLRGQLSQPASRESLEFLVSRVFTDLDGVTEQMATSMTRVLADGLVQGKNPREVGKTLSASVDIAKGRATTIAQTELLRAHNEAQLTALENLGVEDVGVAVEWDTVGDGRVCPLCRPLEGIVLRLSEARGMLPRHPRCRCVWIPSGLGEEPEGAKATKSRILRAIDASRRAERGKGQPALASEQGAWGPGAPIAKDRPESILTNTLDLPLVQLTPAVLKDLTVIGKFLLDNKPRPARQISNAFCPTGPGGGINPHCSPGSGFDTGTGIAAYVRHHAAAAGLKLTDLYLKKVELFNPSGVQSGTFLMVRNRDKSVNDKHRDFYRSILPPGTVIKIQSVSAAELAKMMAASPHPQAAGVPKPLPPPSPSPHAHLPVVPYQTETSWTTGVAQPGVLNGVPFAPAPPKFWEKTKDVDVKEPTPLKTIQRASVIIKEPDGRVWVVEPTGHFGNRNHTLPGGTNEPHLTQQQNALKEVWEETGLQIKITGHLGDFEDSNNGRFGRLYVAERIGGAPWDAKVEASIRHPATGNPAAESETVKLVTPERAAQLLHRTDDLAQLATVHPIDVKTKPTGNVVKKILDGIAPAADAYKSRETRKGQKPGDPTLHAVQELRGYNGKPKVVSEQDMDALIAGGQHVEMLRGLSSAHNLTAAEMAKQFKEGDHFPGFGCFGSGTYADSSKGSSNVGISQYGAGGSVVRIALPKNAKIIDQSELEKIVGPRPPGNFQAAGHHQPIDSWLGIQAALAGYDAIRVDGKSGRHYSYGKGFYAILNRSILTVQTEDAKGHVIK